MCIFWHWWAASIELHYTVWKRMMNETVLGAPSDASYTSYKSAKYSKFISEASTFLKRLRVTWLDLQFWSWLSTKINSWGRREASDDFSSFFLSVYISDCGVCFWNNFLFTGNYHRGQKHQGRLFFLQIKNVKINKVNKVGFIWFKINSTESISCTAVRYALIPQNWPLTNVQTEQEQWTIKYLDQWTT